MKKTLLRRTALWGAVTAAVLLAAFIPAGPAPAQDAKAAGTTNGAAAAGSKNNALSHTLAATNAGAAWDELEEAISTRPPFPDAWQLKEPTPEEQAHFLLPYALAVADKAKDFYTRFPNDTNAVEAKLSEFGALSFVVEKAAATNQQARLDAVEKAMIADPRLPEDDRFGLRHHAVEKAVQEKEVQGDAAMLVEFEKGARLLQKEFPKRPEVMDMLMDLALFSEPEKSLTVVKEIIAMTNAPDELRDEAQTMQKQLDRVGHPLALKYSAIDGREVDLEKMRGKVVLVDFWATWSRESLEMLDDVKQTYDKFHAGGFEVAGINMDEEKESLTNFVAEEHLAWPQFNDGKFRDTKYAVEFGVKALPALWLVDKKGVLRYINGGFDFTNKVAHLMAE